MSVCVSADFNYRRDVTVGVDCKPRQRSVVQNVRHEYVHSRRKSAGRSLSPMNVPFVVAVAGTPGEDPCDTAPGYR